MAVEEIIGRSFDILIEAAMKMVFLMYLWQM